jgi:4-hydroxy-tetrahydrodipicolinate synthase
VVAGIGSNSTAHSVELAQQAEKLGADALLLVTPYYNKPGQAGVLHHVQQVVGATSTPVVLYDVPGRTGTQISLETYERVKGDTVVAVKDAVGDFARGVRLQQLGYAVYSGDDAANLGWLAHGASGVISVVGHAAGRPIRSMIEDFLDGNTVAALKTYQRLLPATDAIMNVPNYGATTAKACLQLLGVLDNRNVRGPLVPLTDDELVALRAGLQASQLL